MNLLQIIQKKEVYIHLKCDPFKKTHAVLLGELVSRITTDTNSMSEALSEELSLLMWYTARFGFLLFYMVSQSWKMTLLTCMGLPIIWVIPKLTGRFHQVM